MEHGVRQTKISGGSTVWTRIGRVALVYLAAFSLPLLADTSSTSAQGPLGVKPTGRTGETNLPALEEKGEKPPPELVLPPVAPKEDEERGGPVLKVFVRKINIRGSTVFSKGELDNITKQYVGREVTSEDLEALRQTLTRYYIKKGYVNSGAIIPDQKVVNGVITLRVIEGKVSNIEVRGNRWFTEGYLQSRLALGTDPPVNITKLQQSLQLLQQNELLERLQAELKAGIKPGESVLRVTVQERPPVLVTAGFDNYQPPSVGSERGWLSVAHRNLTGHGDALRLSYGRSQGVNPQLDIGYALPITAHDTTVSMRYRKNDFAVVEEPFEPLNIESKSDIYHLSLRQPLYRDLNQEFALSLAGERLWNRTSLLGEPFSFSPGAVDGESTVTAVRFSQEWTYRTQREVVAARSRFSLGVDALGATTHGSGLPDGRFLSWLGQFQWTRLLRPYDLQLIFRTDIQLSSDPLLPLEQIAVGGRYSVRGYRENQLVRDQGLIASLESRIPLVRNVPWAEYLQVVPFVDFGEAWNKDVQTPSPRSISSVGLGMRWAATLMEYPFHLRPQVEIYWGYRLRHVENPENDLQDDGIHFQLVIAGF
jgi:hemolysin activation/secretion protein